MSSFGVRVRCVAPRSYASVEGPNGTLKAGNSYNLWASFCRYAVRLSVSLKFCNLDALSTRRANLSKAFFDKVCEEDSCLHDQLPRMHDFSATSQLRHV
jgi:hypothetical protein